MLFLLISGILYVAYITVAQPNSLLRGRDAAPVAVLADENGADEPPSETGNGADPDKTDPIETEVSSPAETETSGGELPAESAGSVSVSPTEDARAGAAYSREEDDEPGDINPFEAFSYYIPENQPEYEAYQDGNPSFPAEDVVWMVNAGLYRSFYTDPVLITDPDPLLINPYNQLPEDFVPPSLEVIDDSGRQATPKTIAAFRSMREGAIRDGFDIAVTSAYRTMDYQRGLYERAGGDGAVARPMFSEHHTGRAIDLWGPDGLLDEAGETETGRWVADHAYEYGFIIRYTAENRTVTGYIPEPWHITYVGIDIARAIRSGGYGSLEEYVAKNPDARL